jgi:hypothetical protein
MRSELRIQIKYMTKHCESPYILNLAEANYDIAGVICEVLVTTGAFNHFRTLLKFLLVGFDVCAVIGSCELGVWILTLLQPVDKRLFMNYQSTCLSHTRIIYLYK